MKLRQFAAVLAVAIFPVAARAADDENPYRKAKVGDFATYKMTTKIAGISAEGTLTQTVTAKDDKEATVTTSGKVVAMGMEIPVREEKMTIDLTKPFDPGKVGNLPPGTEVKVEKLKDGTEKLKVGDKTYDSKWETFKMKAKLMGMEFEAEMKVWQAKELSIPMVKMEMAADMGGQKMEVLMELTETGAKDLKKDEKAEDKKADKKEERKDEKKDVKKD
ncbi:MAG TPA: hypothetical protein VKE40_08765 [Gemmataceae bacterium]|nr:hypothetical protein [Gemmataceae bacterium]